MKYRRLGSTGITVSEIGFGTWGLGGDSYGPVDDAASRQALLLAVELGTTFYDTSDLYGNGHSETVLGDAFLHCRDKVVIATKGGTLPHSGFSMPQDFSASHLRRSLEASLRRLKTDYVDLYQLHSPPIDLPNWEEVISTLKKLRQEGKILSFGISARSPQDAKSAIEKLGFEVVQVNYNLMDHRAVDSGLFELCRLMDVGVIARTPLCFGYLAERMKGDEEFQGRDHRANWPREQLLRWAHSSQFFSSLNEGSGRTLAQFALKFCLSDDCVGTVIPGMMTCAEVRENAAVADIPPLAGDECETIRSLYRNHNIYDSSIKQRVS